MRGKKDDQPLSRKSRLIFFQTLAVMLDAGLPLTQALRALETDTTEDRLRRFATDCRASVEGGSALSVAVKESGLEKLSKYQQAMLKVAESSGTLHLCLGQLASEEEEAGHIQQRLASALVYPISVFVLVSLFLFLFLPLIVFPQYLSLVDGLHIPESGLFGWVLWFMRSTQGPAFWGLVVALLALLVSLVRNASVRKIAIRSLIALFPNVTRVTVADISKQGGEDVCLGAVGTELCLKYLRPIGRLLQAAYSARFAKALGIVLSSGGNLLKGLPLACQAASSDLLVYHSKEMAEILKEGEPLASALDHCGAFPPIFLQMIAVGEESGRVPELCAKAASFYGEILEHFSQDAIAVLEPLLTALLGLVVGAIVLLSMYPILEVIRSL